MGFHTKLTEIKELIDKGDRDTAQVKLLAYIKFLQELSTVLKKFKTKIEEKEVINFDYLYDQTIDAGLLGSFISLINGFYIRFKEMDNYEKSKMPYPYHIRNLLKQLWIPKPDPEKIKIALDWLLLAGEDEFCVLIWKKLHAIEAEFNELPRNEITDKKTVDKFKEILDSLRKDLIKIKYDVYFDIKS
jgi:hypothetical protein